MFKHFSVANYLTLFSVCMCLTITVAASAALEAKKEGNTLSKQLQVKIYYASLSPESMSFIRSQLYPSMTEYNRLPYTQLDFVPYGKVDSYTIPKTNFTKLRCQHGRTECKFNAVQGCIVEHNKIREQLELINCLMSSYFQDIDEASECAKKLKIDVQAAKKCRETRLTADILKRFGKETDAIGITFVPTIAIDGAFNRSEQSNIRSNFDRIFCQKYKQKYGVELANC